MTAASSESGILVNEMKAVLRSSRNTNNTTTTREPPTRSEKLMCCSDRSMNVAGRNNRG
jgi:hypothetical protein